MSQFFTVELSDPRFESDNLRLITVKSMALNKRADISVFVPSVPVSELKGMVILLHGVYGSHWAWTLKGGVHKTAHRLINENKMPPMLLVMPSDGLFADGSGYVPHVSEDYEKWIVEDVVSVVTQQIAGRPLPLFITGLSMGGYGAMRLGAKYSDRFRAFSGHSSVTELGQLSQFVEDFDRLLSSVQTQESVLESILQHKATLPPFWFDCGTDDILIEYNRHLHQALVQHGIDHQYNEFSGGHEWPYWEEHIVDSLLFFGRFCP
ncbi:alpha/beta hydrolase [Runella aurantiaca]|uniref:Esterase family protein n=1 Tax=Runella aurantiaca TaxID=2282308 RepID=A0A369I6J9_9BACT|nr:alpha/beta hydrolase-fold protein [Runella aurantiaca]RDB05441.1 esterase family protein [Runella aurantiaca]